MQTNSPVCVLPIRLLRIEAAAMLPVLSALLVVPAQGNHVITGSDGSIPARVERYTGESLVETASFLPYGGGFTGGVRVAAGDVNGDGTPDIVTGTGAGAGPRVKVFSGSDQSELKSFFAYTPSFTGGVYVAAGDVNGDGRADLVTGSGSDATHVKVFDSVNHTEIHSFFAYPGANLGVRVASGDLNGDGVADIVTSLGEGFASHVKVFDGTNLSPLASFFAYGAGFTGGVHVAAGDVNGDGFDDVITGAGVGGGTHVKVFSGDGGGELHSFFAYPGINGDLRVGAGDVNGDGLADIITGIGAGFVSQVKVFRTPDLNQIGSFFAYDTSYTQGVYVAGVTPVVRVPECSTFALVCVGLFLVGLRRGFI